MPIRTDAITGSGNTNPFDHIGGAKPTTTSTTTAGPVHHSGSGDDGGDTVGATVRGKVAGFSAGFAISDGLKERVQSLEGKLAGELQLVADTKNGADDAEKKKTTAWGKLNVWDKHFRWIPVAHDKEKITAFKDAKAADGGADSALEKAQAQADATDRAIRNEIAAFLRQAQGTNFGELEQGHREAHAALQATQSFKRAVRDAISAVENAISAKQWDNMSDAMKHNRPHHSGGHHGHHHGPHGAPGFGGSGGFDFQDMQAMSARSDAQAAIGRAQGAAEGFRAMLASYRGQVVGGTGSLAGISVGGGFFDFFLNDNVWMGMWQINDMQQARGQLESVAAQIGSIEGQIGGHVQSFKSAMDAQINAVRRAAR